MSLELGVWRIDNGFVNVSPTKLDEEARLETFVNQHVALVRDDLWIIGRQVPTAFGHFIDLLAMDGQGNLVVLELKRDKTPREVVAQSLDYGSWVGRLGREELARIYDEYVRKYAAGTKSPNLDVAFSERFGQPVPESLNESHELIVVAAALDDSTERIISYLVDYGVPINAVFFRVFKDGDREYLTRAWFKDPAEAHAKSEELHARQKGREPWNGSDFYVSFGEGPHRNWEDARKYGFVSAGGGAWFTRTLRLLQPGNRVFVAVPKKGYVGVGRVVDTAKRADQAVVGANGDSQPLRSVPPHAKDMLHPGNDDEAETVVRVEWEKTLPVEDAIWETGMFSNQNSACKLRSQFTIQRLSQCFGLDK
jgi:hypothetical protein